MLSRCARDCPSQSITVHCVWEVSVQGIVDSLGWKYSRESNRHKRPWKCDGWNFRPWTYVCTLYFTCNSIPAGVEYQITSRFVEMSQGLDEERVQLKTKIFELTTAIQGKTPKQCVKGRTSSWFYCGWHIFWIHVCVRVCMPSSWD